jgi:hypothetical protein
LLGSPPSPFEIAAVTGAAKELVAFSGLPAQAADAPKVFEPEILWCPSDWREEKETFLPRLQTLLQDLTALCGCLCSKLLSNPPKINEIASVRDKTYLMVMFALDRANSILDLAARGVTGTGNDRPKGQSRGDRVSAVGGEDRSPQPRVPGPEAGGKVDRRRTVGAKAHEIPADRQTRPMTKREAARLMGYKSHKKGKEQWKQPAENLSRLMEDGNIKFIRKNRQIYIFDIDDFPPNVREQIRPGPAE